MNTSTLKARLRDKERQRFFVTYLAGKMLGMCLAVGAMVAIGPWIVGTIAHAASPSDTPPPQVADVVNATNTAWTLIAAFLVFFMQAGFMMLANSARLRSSSGRSPSTGTA